MLTVTLPPPEPDAATPSRPSGPRASGTIASGPASPARPTRLAPSGKKLGAAITPPLANGCTGPSFAALPAPADVPNPPNKFVRPLASPLVTGLSATFRDRVDSRSASDVSTESKLFAPIAPCAKAAVIARANAFEPAVKSRVRVRTPSRLDESASVVPGSPASVKSSAIRGSPHERKFHTHGTIREQRESRRGRNDCAHRLGSRSTLTSGSARRCVRKPRAQLRKGDTVERRLARPQHGFDGGGKFTRRHAPERIGRKTQHAKPET